VRRHEQSSELHGVRPSCSQATGRFNSGAGGF
jgi:hypothetical protein